MLGLLPKAKALLSSKKRSTACRLAVPSQQADSSSGYPENDKWLQNTS